MSCKKRKLFSLDQKIELIRAIERGERKSTLCKRYGISSSTVSTIWKYKDKIYLAKASGKSGFKIRIPKFDDLDQVMVRWYQEQIQNHAIMTTRSIIGKAEDFAKCLGIIGFKASRGWLSRFKQRHNLNKQCLELEIDAKQQTTSAVEIQNEQHYKLDGMDCELLEESFNSLDSGRFEENNSEGCEPNEEDCHKDEVLLSDNLELLPNDSENELSLKDHDESHSLLKDSYDCDSPLQNFHSFGEFVVNELHSLRSRKNQNKLKRMILQCIQEISELDDDILNSKDVVSVTRKTSTTSNSLEAVQIKSESEF